MQVSSPTTSGTTTSGTTTSGTTTSGTTSSSSNSSTTAASATVDYNSFLQLMIAELQNQDPTNPTDPTQYMSQLASFSAVGQAVQTNQKLDAMMTSSALAQADSTIGRTVTSADGSTSGKVTSVLINSDGSVTATLDSGKTMALGNGVTLS